MKKGRIIALNIFVLVVACIYAIVLILGNVFVATSNVAVVPGSYGAQYANDKHLTIVELSDDQLGYFNQRYEKFHYNYVGDGVVLEFYYGQSYELVVPAYVEGSKVVGLGEEFFDSLKTVKKVFIPDSVRTVAGDVDNTVKIGCSEDCIFYQANKDKGWSFDLMYDSDFVNFWVGDLEFNYNVNGSTIEITSYYGNDDKVLIIPAYVNGYPVTKVSMDILGIADIVVIPETVTEITGKTVAVLYSTTFAIELIFTILAFVVSLIFIDVIIPRFKNKSEYILSGNQIVLIAVYVVVQTAFSIITTYYLYCDSYLALIISLVILAVFIALQMLTGQARKHVQEVDAKIAAATSRMKGIKASVKNLSDSVKNADLRKKVQRLEDEIRFSDAVTRNDLDDMEAAIEKQIEELKKAIELQDESQIDTISDSLMKLVKERNVKCKAGK